MPGTLKVLGTSLDPELAVSRLFGVSGSKINLVFANANLESIEMSHPKNKVLTDDNRTSSNFFESDLILWDYLERHLDSEIHLNVEPHLQRLGKKAATQMDALSQKADKHRPRLNTRNKFGKVVYEVEFHPAYWELMNIAAETGDEDEQQLLRIITPMAKWLSAEQSVYAVRECMELMGGNGYIEDFVMPKILRDVNVADLGGGQYHYFGYAPCG